MVDDIITAAERSVADEKGTPDLLKIGSWIINLVVAVLGALLLILYNQQTDTVRRVDIRVSAAEATLSGRGERIARLETDSSQFRIMFAENTARLQRIEDKLDDLRSGGR